MSTLFSLSEFRVVCPFDPAIDAESDVIKYAELRDMDLLKVRGGETMTIFHIRRLTQSRVLTLMSQSDVEETRHAIAFMSSVVKVQNLRMPDGSTNHAWVPSWLSASGETKSEIMKDHEMELFAIDEILDIGSVAYQRAFLRHGRPVCFLPPQSSAIALGKKMRSFHLAEQVALLSKKQDDLSISQPPKCEPDGAPLGDVIAKDELSISPIVS